MIRLALIALIAWLGRSVAIAQYPLVRTLHAMDGQQGVLATCIAQDSLGLVWLGGPRGLFRTDGDRTDAILRTENDAVLAVCGTTTGAVAALASGAVLRCDGARCDTLWTDTAFKEAPVRSLVIDARGDLWVGTYGAGAHVWRNGKVKRLTMSTGLADDHVNDLCPTGTGRMVIATDLGIIIVDLDGRAITVLGEEQGAPDNLTLSLACASDGRMWCGTDRGGVFSFQPEDPATPISLLDSGWADGPVHHLAATRDRLWIGAGAVGTVVCDLSNGLAYYRPTTPEQGARNEVLSFLRDRDGAVWWCDGTTALHRADPHVLLTAIHEGVDMRRISAIAALHGHRIALADRSRILVHATTFREAQRIERVPLPTDSGTTITALREDAHGNLWAGTFGHGVHRLGSDKRMIRFNAGPDAVNDNVLAIHARGDTVWFATLDGIFRRTTSGPHDVCIRVAIPGSGFTYDLLPLADGTVLVATDGNGIIRIERDGSARQLPGAEPDDRTFYSLCSNGVDVWTCGPSTGVYRVERDRLTAISADAGTVMNEVYAFTAYAGRLFIFGDGGAFLVDPTNGRTTELTNALALRDAQAELNTAVADGDGQLWTATDRGLYRLSPGIALHGEGIKAAITEARQGAEGLVLGVRADLPADRDFLTFRFTGIHYDAPEDLRFAYRLIGTDTVLRVTRDRELSFSHLVPGTYRFEVYAFVGRHPMNAVPAFFDFTIASPWWQRPWAIAAGVLLLGLLVFSGVRLRDNRLRARDRMEKVQAEMEREKVRFQMQVLRSQVNPHFLFNSFNTLIGLIEEAPDKAVKHVEHLSDFFREILQVRDKELIPLRDELRLVDTYFFLEQRRFGDRIALRTSTTQGALDALVPPLTVQLLVENALKHNRASDQEPLVITIDAGADLLTVTNPFRPRDTAAKSTRFGLDSIAQRFAAITTRPVVIGPENGTFVARIPLIPPNHEDPDR